MSKKISPLELKFNFLSKVKFTIKHPKYLIKKFLWKRGLIYKDYDLILEMPWNLPGRWMNKKANFGIPIDEIVSCTCNSYTKGIGLFEWKNSQD
jgi:hypothetical protein